MALCARFTGLKTINDDNQRDLRAFMDASGVSMQALGEAITKAGGDPRGKPVTKSRVWNYVRGMADTPGWFLARMNELFPGWRELKSEKASGQNPTGASKVDMGAAPLLPPVGDPTMKNLMSEAEKEGWRWRRLEVPSFLDARFPVQYVVESCGTALAPGDVVQLRPNAYAKLDTLFAVTEKATGQGFYAAFVAVDGSHVWQRADGSTLSYAECHIDAAVTAILPQYHPGKEEGTINSAGLNVKTQVVWVAY